MTVLFVFGLFLLLNNLMKTHRTDNCTSKAWFDYLRAFFSICVVFHHMVKCNSVSQVEQVVYENLGYLSVAVFFMISGYGMAYKYSQGYPQKYMIRKIANLLGEYLLVNALYAIWELIEFHSIDVDLAVENFKHGIMYADNSWYILLILIVYLLMDTTNFLLINKEVSFQLRSKVIIGFMIVFWAGYTALLIIMGWGGYWYVSFGSFMLGMIIFRNKQLLIRSVRSTFIIVFIIFILSIISSIMIDKWSVSIVIKVISSSTFAFLCVLLGTKFEARDSKIIKLLSNISLEVYLLHGLSFRLLRNTLYYVGSDYLFSALSIVICLLLAFVLRGVFNMIKKMQNLQITNKTAIRL